jgi:hypothetical protein
MAPRAPALLALLLSQLAAADYIVGSGYSAPGCPEDTLVATQVMGDGCAPYFGGASMQTLCVNATYYRQVLYASSSCRGRVIAEFNSSTTFTGETGCSLNSNGDMWSTIACVTSASRYTPPPRSLVIRHFSGSLSCQGASAAVSVYPANRCMAGTYQMVCGTNSVNMTEYASGSK